MSLKTAFAPTKSKNNSSKTPAYYNQEKNNCIAKLVIHTDTVVRSAVLSSPHIPAKMLTEALKIEQDKNVLRLILMNKNLSRKAVAEFVNDATDDRVDWFEDDQELIEHFTQTITQ